ncbi:MAG: magnesium transporter CorA [Gemmatimonadales bacterium]|nr:magnesium transporter CorA [Gemmatimonadales bacterium]
MTRNLVLETTKPRLEWLDLIDPSLEELHAIASHYQLFSTLVEDSLEAAHLPKYEKVGDTTFIIVRAYDEHAPADASTVQELTRKVAIFCGPGFIVTIHRVDLPFFVPLREEFRTRAGAGEAARLPHGLAPSILIDLINAAVESYVPPLDRAEDDLDRLENCLFAESNLVELLRDIHILKRRISLIKRLLWHTFNTVVRLVPASAPSAPLYQDLRESVESLHFQADEMLDQVNNLLNIHLGLASHRTNQTVRILTVFSVFFMPLTFIVGVYGMNFQFMPELHSRWGYPGVLALMVLVSTAIYIWFRRRGWLSE